MENLFAILIIIILIALFIRLLKKKNNNHWKKPFKPFSASWRKLLFENVNFYDNLELDDKQRFEFKVHEFLINCKITGVGTEVFEIDCVLVAASAINSKED